MTFQKNSFENSLDFFISSWITRVSFGSLKSGHDFYIDDASGIKKLTMDFSVHVIKAQRELNGIIHACAEFHNSLITIQIDPIKNILLSERLYENCVIRIRAYQEKLQSSIQLLGDDEDVKSKIKDIKHLMQRCLSKSMKISKSYIGQRNEILHERGYSVPRGDLAIIMELVVPERRDEVSSNYGYSSSSELIIGVRNDFANSYNAMHNHIDVFESEFSVLCNALRDKIEELN